MLLTYTGKNVQVTEAMKELTEKKFSKLDKYFKDDITGRVTFSTQRNLQKVEVTIDLPGTVLRAEEATNDMYQSIDKAVDVLARQIRKHKTKLQQKLQGQETIRFENVPVFEEADSAPKIVKTKNFALSPMTEEEALLQIELLGHDFFVFYDDETEIVKILYKRKDGNYGLLVPEI